MFERMFFLVAVACLSLVACTVALPGPDHEFHNYQTAVAHAPEQGWTPYWLGRSFEQGGITFRGPAVVDFGDEIDGGGVVMSYDADVPGAGYDFDVSVFSRAAWAGAVRRGFAKRLVGSEQQTVEIAGQDATVTSGPVHNEGVRIDIDFADTHVLARVAQTPATRAASPSVTMNESSPLRIAPPTTHLSMTRELAYHRLV